MIVYMLCTTRCLCCQAASSLLYLHWFTHIYVYVNMGMAGVHLLLHYNNNYAIYVCILFTCVGLHFSAFISTWICFMSCRWGCVILCLVQVGSGDCYPHVSYM